jgi:hypothetical protein
MRGWLSQASTASHYARSRLGTKASIMKLAIVVGSRGAPPNAYVTLHEDFARAVEIAATTPKLKWKRRSPRDHAGHRIARLCRCELRLVPFAPIRPAQRLADRLAYSRHHWCQDVDVRPRPTAT